eukprot:2121725-Karenia_brevis.AAC.1
MADQMPTQKPPKPLFVMKSKLTNPSATDVHLTENDFDPRCRRNVTLYFPSQVDLLIMLIWNYSSHG